MYEKINKMLGSAAEKQDLFILSGSELSAIRNALKALNNLYLECESSDGFNPNLEGPENEVSIEAQKALNELEMLRDNEDKEFINYIASVQLNEDGLPINVNLFKENGGDVTSSEADNISTTCRWKQSELLSKESLATIKFGELYYVRSGGSITYLIPDRIEKGNLYCIKSDKEGVEKGREVVVIDIYKLTKKK